MHRILRFFDKLEDKVRGRLSRTPILYAFIGGSGVVIYWRGVWHSMDYLMQFLAQNPSYPFFSWWDGPLSITLGATILLLTGVFVPSFVGNEIIISGLRGEKKLTEKTEAEVRGEGEMVARLSLQIKNISENLAYLNKKINTGHGK
jgi:low affinity Fe/Cu permease